MPWKLDNATILKLVKRKARGVLPFAHNNNQDDKVTQVTPIESKHKSRDTVTGFTWVRARRRFSMGNRKSKRITRALSLTSKRSNHSLRAHPPPPPSSPPLPSWTLKLRQSRSSDFRQSYQVIEVPPDLTAGPSIPASPVWGLDGVINAPQPPKLDTLPSSTIYGLNGIMDAPTSDQSKPLRITVNFTNPRPLGQVIEESEAQIASLSKDDKPSQLISLGVGEGPIVSGPVPAPIQPSPPRPRSLRLSRKRRRKLNAAVDSGLLYLRPAAQDGDQDRGRESPDGPRQAEHESLDQARASGEDALEEKTPDDPALAMPSEGGEVQEQMPNDSISGPSLEHSGNLSQTDSPREVDESIGEWRLEVAQAASLRGSSCSPSASFASRDDYANTRSSANRHRRSPATYSAPPTTTPQTRPSSSSVPIVAVDGSQGVTVLRYERQDEHKPGNTGSREAQINFSSGEPTLNSFQPSPVVRSRSRSSGHSLRSSVTIFDSSDGRARYAPTVTPSTSRGTSSPSAPLPAPWDLDLTKSTTTRVGDRWSAAYLQLRLEDSKSQTTEEPEWKKHWGPYGRDERGCLVNIGIPRKIYWTNAQAPTPGFNSHWQPSPGFQSSTMQGRQRHYDPTTARRIHSW